jgi:hypothetical protein
MLPVNPWLPLTLLVVADRDPALEPPAKDLLPANEELDPNRDPPLVDPIEELPKCEPSMFDTPRFGEIELRAADVPVIPPRLDPDMLDDPPKFPACEFDATEGAFEPLADPCDAPATEELPVFAPACVPAVLPALPPAFRALLLAAPPEPLPEPPNECQLPSEFARVAPRPAVDEPDDRAFKLLERPALFAPLRPADEAAPPFRAFAEFPAERPAFIPFERAPPFPAPPYSRGTPARP